MRYLLGVDGGASKTHALIVDETGRAVGFGEGGTSNHQVHGLPHAMHELETAVRAALREANIRADALDCGYFCLAGADLPADYTMLREAVSRLNLAQRFMINNDTIAALRAGLSRSWGVTVICGTGFNGGGRGPDGHEIQLPGLGFISGDKTGGSTIAENMIQAVMRGWDGRGKPTKLRELILDALSMPDEETLLEKLYSEEIPYRALIKLVPLVFEASIVGDGPAADILVDLGTEVGLTANALIRRLSLQTTDVEVVLGGSIFKGKGPLLIDTVRQVVHREAPYAKLIQLSQEPVFGAALLALEQSGIAANNGVYSQLNTTIRQLPRYPQAEQAPYASVTDQLTD